MKNRPPPLVLLALLLPLARGQYEHPGYLQGYPEAEHEPYRPPQLAPDVPRIQLRLAGDKRKHNEGRVEVFYDGQWGTVCDDDFTQHAAQVVCRELGYVDAVSWSPSSKYGKGEGPIWFDNLHCTGKEKTLAQCPSNGIGVSDCKHSEDVGVVCSDKRIPGFKFLNSLANHVEPVLAGWMLRWEGLASAPIRAPHCGVLSTDGSDMWKLLEQAPPRGSSSAQKLKLRPEAQAPLRGKVELHT